MCCWHGLCRQVLRQGRVCGGVAWYFSKNYSLLCCLFPSFHTTQKNHQISPHGAHQQRHTTLTTPPLGSYKVFCLIGDGESAEGSIWEAIHFCSYYHLDNVVAVVDVNRLGQSQATSLAHDMDTYQNRFRAFGWATA